VLLSKKMIKRLGLVGTLIGFVVVAGMGTLVKADDIKAESRAFIQIMANKAIQSLTANEISRVERIKRFRLLFNDRFAVRSIGKFVLGRHWRKASKDEKIEYLGLFEDFMVISYFDRFISYAGETLQFKNTRIENKSNVTVFSEIKQPNGAKPIHINWRVGNNGSIYKVLDVVVEGISMSNTLRSDFGSIISQKDGKVLGLIEELKKKISSLQADLKN
jgi:phospholipid transport system substrate-binding protein